MSDLQTQEDGLCDHGVYTYTYTAEPVYML
jgi:hypothetical protein